MLKQEKPRPMAVLEDMLLAGLEEIAIGFAVFDDQLKLVHCNGLYPRIRSYPPNLCQPGSSLADLFHFNAARGDYGAGDPAQQVAERIARVRLDVAIDVDQTLGDGRILVSRYRPLADGGLVTTYEDVTELRRAAATLQRDQERYELVTEAISEGLYDWLVASDTLRVTDRLNRLFDFEHGELTASDWVARMHPDDLSGYTIAMRQHFKGAVPRLEATYRIRDKTGAYRWVEDHALALRDTAGRAVRLVGAIADVSDRKAAEEALHKSEERYALAMSAINEGIYEFDVQADEVFYSDSLYKATGLGPDEMRTKRDWLDRIHPDDLPPYRQAMAAHFRGETPRFQCEVRYRHPDGTWHWARQHGTAVRDESGRVIRIVGSTGNITAEKTLAAELDRARTRLSEALESISQGFALFDADDRLVMCNQTYRRFFADTADPEVAAMLVPGMRFEDYVRKAYDKGMYPDAGDDIDDYMESRLARRRAPTGGHELRLRGGTWLYITERRVRDGGLVAVYTDITEAKLREAQLQAARDRAEAVLADLRIAQDQLIHAEKMASLGQLTAGIAHEIKNPLNFVNNFAKLSAEMMDELGEVLAAPLAALSEGERDDAEDLMATVRGNLQKIDEHGRRADSIVRNMLLHSRDSSGDSQSVDLNAVAQEAINLAYHGARAVDAGFKVELESDFASDIGAIYGQPQELQRVFLNLCSNGMYAATRRSAADGALPKVSVRSRLQGTTVIIEVADNGDGVPEAIRDKIFLPFFTTKPTGEGTGLGLSMTYDIVKQHGGAIELDSEDGRGTTFRMSFPRAREATSRGATE